MNDYMPTESTKVVIGVCGEQGSGKTVFLTCIFQSIGTAFPDDFIVDFDRKEIGNANYFQRVEDEVIAKGPTQGTIDRTLFPVRIFVRPVESLPGSGRPTLSVDLVDFAGRHFRSMADLKDLMEASDSDPDDIKALREVNETLEQADAFVLLINSTEIDPGDETPKRNPFSPSVNFMLAHCRAERKPVALLFSQIDQTPRLTEEVFRTLPRVQAFERQFTPDLQEASQGQRPFGIVRRISCYETVPGDLAPRRQTLDGSIWRPEPAQVILELLRAAMPRINERLARKVKEEADQKHEREARELRKQKGQWALRIAALVIVLVMLGLLLLGWYKRTERHQVRLVDGVTENLRSGRLVAISPQSQASLAAILTAHEADSDGTVTAVEEAIGDLESALGEAARRLAEEPLLEPFYGQEIARFRGLVPLFGPAVTGAWHEEVLPLLDERSKFLSDWFGTERTERRARTSFLDEAALRFLSSGDRAFYSLLTAQSTSEKEAEVAGWQAKIEADADVASRLATIQSLLGQAVAEQDPELLRLARKALAGHLVAAILKRQENDLLREMLLTPLVPNLARLGDGEVRFEGLARGLLGCPDEEECANHKETVQSVFAKAEETTASRTSGVDNFLRSLLLDLPAAQRPEVWEALAEALASSYLFSARPDAWPGEIGPLHARIRALANAEIDRTEDLIERIAQRPIYEGELRYLGDRLTTMAIRRRVVRFYSELLSSLERQGLLPTGGLAQVSKEVSSALADRVEATGPLVEIEREIEQVLALAKSVNDQRDGPGDPSAPVRLERLLNSAKRSHCGALEAHAAPPECIDAE